MQTTPSRTEHSALWQGVIWGTLLGAMLLVYNLVYNLGNLDATGETWLKNGLLIIMFVLPGLAGYIGSRETGRVKSGALAVLSTGLVGAVIGIFSLWVITLVFMNTLRHNALMIIGFQQSRMTNMGAFIVEGALGGSIFIAVFLLAFGAGYGLLGSLLGAQSARQRTRQ